MLISSPLITVICCVARGAGIFFTIDLFAFDTAIKGTTGISEIQYYFFYIIESIFVYL